MVVTLWGSVSLCRHAKIQVLRGMGQGIGILVSKFPKETAASYSLRDPVEVRRIYSLSPPDPSTDLKEIMERRTNPPWRNRARASSHFLIVTVIELLVLAI